MLGAGEAKQCPDDMVLVIETQTCMDRFEWPNQLGALPMVGFSAIPSAFDQQAGLVMDARALCRSVGKRMCRMDEWSAGCRGPEKTAYPFGAKLPKQKPSPQEAPCNYAQPYIRPDYAKVFLRDPDEMRRLYQADPSGARGCVSDSGANDMMGNVEEWVECPSTMSLSGASCVTEKIGGQSVRSCFCLAGRYWSGPVKCEDMVSGHAPGYHDYETGFRCCADLGAAPNGS